LPGLGASKTVPKSRFISFWIEATSRSGSQRTIAMTFLLKIAKRYCVDTQYEI
jgi:hypothetical protein